MGDLRGLNAHELISRLNEMDVKLRADGEKLQVSARQGILSTELRDRIVALKPDLLRILQQAEAVARRGLPPLTRNEATGPKPLSFGQERIWFLDRLEPDRATYNIVTVMRLSGPLDVPALNRALLEVVHRHASLSCAVESVDGNPCQRACPPEEFALPIEDLSGLAADEREPELRAALAREAHRPFDLAKPPLLRARLIRAKPDEHLLSLCVHHIAADAASVWIVLRELATLYSSRVKGAPVRLSEQPFDYTDYASWQREVLDDETLEQDVAYWRGRLHGTLPILDLPTRRGRVDSRMHEGATVRRFLGAGLKRRLSEFNRGRGVTMFATLLAAYRLCLGRWSRQHDVIIGTTVSGRPLAELESMVGFFVNTLALRMDTSGEPSFEDFVKHAHATNLEALAHQNLPFERLVEAIEPRRHLGRTPVFQAAFNLLEDIVPDMRLEGLDCEFIGPPDLDAKFDLTLVAIDQDDELCLSLDHDTSRYDTLTAERFLDSMIAMLTQGLATPTLVVSELTGVDAGSRIAIERLGGGSRTPETPARTLCDILDDAAVEHGDSVALEWTGGAMSYRELDEVSARMARGLVHAGVGPGDLVGVLVPPGGELVSSIVAILKAGAAFLPLSAELPDERIRFMLEDASVTAVVATERTASSVPSGAWSVVSPATLASDGDVHGDGSLPARPAFDDLAYVIYTSGSTGRPKGVEIEHRSIVAFLAAMAREPGVDATDVLASVTTITFDISLLEIFLPLSVGARTVLVDREVATDGTRLATLLDASGATMMQATPATWRLLLECGWTGRPELRALCGGEAWGVDLARELGARCHSVWNMYGPTEATIWSSVRRIGGLGRTRPIGPPIPGSWSRVVDENGRLVPFGVPGELVLGGPGWRAGTGIVRSSPPSASPPCRTPVSETSGAIARGISCEWTKRAISSSSVGSTTRSRSAVTGSSSVRSKPPCARIPGSKTPRPW